LETVVKIVEGMVSKGLIYQQIVQNKRGFINAWYRVMRGTSLANLKEFSIAIREGQESTSKGEGPKQIDNYLAKKMKKRDPHH
jgi:hypothetical protein